MGCSPAGRRSLCQQDCPSGPAEASPHPTPRGVHWHIGVAPRATSLSKASIVANPILEKGGSTSSALPACSPPVTVSCGLLMLRSFWGCLPLALPQNWWELVGRRTCAGGRADFNACVSWVASCEPPASHGCAGPGTPAEGLGPHPPLDFKGRLGLLHHHLFLLTPTQKPSLGNENEWWAGSSASWQLWPVLEHLGPGYTGLDSETVLLAASLPGGIYPMVGCKSETQENLAHDSGTVLHRGRSWGQKSNRACGL